MVKNRITFLSLGFSLVIKSRRVLEFLLLLQAIQLDRLGSCGGQHHLITTKKAVNGVNPLYSILFSSFRSFTRRGELVPLGTYIDWRPGTGEIEPVRHS